MKGGTITEKHPKIGMLLDINNLYGQHQGRLTPWLLVAALGLSPTLFYVYQSLWLYVPLQIFIPLNVLLIIRLIMIFPGRERYRLEIYRRQIHDTYAETASLLNIKMIHPDGLIEFTNGKVMYLVAAYNGTVDNVEVQSAQYGKFIAGLTAGYEYDMYIHNTCDSEYLRKYYEKINQFPHNNSASNFAKMIDYSIDLSKETSLVQQTIFAIRGGKSDWKKMKKQIDSILSSRLARCYKSVYRVGDMDSINEVFNRDSDSVVHLEELMRRKYATGDYATSRVLVYDLPDDQVVIQGTGTQNPVLPKQTKNTFHIAYNEDKEEVEEDAPVEEIH